MSHTRIVLLAIVAVAMSLPAVGETEVAQVCAKDGTAMADYVWPNGCLLNQVNVIASRPRLQQEGSGAPDEAPVVSLTLVTIDYCDPAAVVPVVVATGQSSDIEFSIDSNLETATLKAASVPVLDQISGTSFSVAADLTWQADGPLDTYAGVIRSREPGYTVQDQTSGRYRSARASGSIISAGTNWIPVPSSLAQMQLANSGQITITRK